MCVLLLGETIAGTSFTQVEKCIKMHLETTDIDDSIAGTQRLLTFKSFTSDTEHELNVIMQRLHQW